MAEVLPPMTVKQLLVHLDNPNFSAYVYIGLDQDKGWGVALFAQQLVPALRVYRADTAVAAELRGQFQVDESAVGIVFGWKREIGDRLSKTKAGNAMTVIQAIKAARAPAPGVTQ